MTIGSLTIAAALAAGAIGEAAAIDATRCEARQPKVEQQLQAGRTRCVVRAERRQARGLDAGFQVCEAKLLAAYVAKMGRAGCDAEPDGAVAPPRHPDVEVRTAWTLVGDEATEVLYEVAGDRAIMHGDIILGTVDEVAEQDRAIRSRIAAGQPARGLQPRSHTRGDFGWSRNAIPFEIEGDLSSTMVSRINTAIAHWNANTIVRLQARNGENDFVRFVDDDSRCASHAGKKGGMQEILVATTCSTGSIMHEIGHAVGLYHEQNRSDRDQFVIVQTENIEDDPQVRAQFDKGPFGSVDRDGFDFNSIMLYDSFAFSANGEATLTRLDGTTWNANRTGLSTGDIAGVTRMVTGLNGLFTPKDKLRNKSANRCMDADTGGQGAAVSIRTCDGTPRQRWLVYTHPRTGRKLVINERSGLCLDVPGGSTTSGRDLIQFPCHGATNQAFTFTRPFAWDPWTIRSASSQLCVALESTTNGGDVEQRTCGTSDQQRWFQELF
jgi:hypothetical protein